MVSLASFADYLAPPQVADSIAQALVGGSPFADALTPITASSGRFVWPISGPSGAGWTLEGAPIPVVSPGDQVLIVAVAKLAGILYLTNEAIADDTMDLGTLLTQAVTDQMKYQLDDGLLHGDGTLPNPQGILGSAPAAAAGPDLRAAVIGAWGELADEGANVEAIRAFVRGSVASAEMARTTAPGLPIHPDGPALQLGPVPVVTVPALAAGEVIVADTSRLYLVRRQGFTVASSAHEGFNTDTVAFRVTGRFAIGCPTPQRSIRTATVTAATTTTTATSA